MLEKFQIFANSEKVSHAYIIEGVEGIEKVQVAKEFAKEILKGENDAGRKIDHGNYEDLILVEAEGRSIKDEAIEELQNRMKSKPFSGSRNIVIIENAGTMTPRAQNRLLKTLEEPPVGTVIMLLTENVENLQQTIRSRCVHYRLPYKDEDIRDNDSFKEAVKLENMIFNRDASFQVFDYISEISKDKDCAHKLLDNLEKWYSAICLYSFMPEKYEKMYSDSLDELKQKNKLYKKEDIYKYVGFIEEARQEFYRNVNTSYTLKSLILKIGG